MITLKQKGNFKNLEKFFSLPLKPAVFRILQKYGQIGVDALSKNTPKDTGETASAWFYSIESNSNGYSLSWNNTSTNGSVNIALLLQYGHGTRSGSFVSGIDYINPAIKPVFEKISSDIWEEVTKV